MRKLLPLLLVAVLAVPASGQSLKGHNSKAPVDVAADRVEVQDRADRAVFVGNVRVEQAGLTLTTARLTLAYDNGGSRVDIQRIDATGGVTVSSATETAHGDIAVYDLPRKLITMVGNVTLVQGANRLSGGRLVINLDTGVASVDGGSPPVRSSDGTITSGGGGRVTGRFTVTQRPQ
ncbi:MAG: LptA/OstA family protein [Sphingomonadaceae bacterium]